MQKLRNKIKIENGTDLQIAKSAKIAASHIEIYGHGNSLRIAEEVKLRDVHIEIVGDNCSITIEKGCVIGHQSYLSAKEDGIELFVGEGCMFSRNVKVMTSDGHPLFCDNKQINKAKSIVIESHVWLGDNVTILKGVSIGSGSVVGINATLTQSIGPNVVAVGNPAKVVKENVVWKK